MGKSQQYLHNVALTISGQIGGINPDLISVHYNNEEFPMIFWSTYGMKITEALKTFGPEAQGRIAACGHGHFEGGDICHWDMNEGRGLNSACSGNQLVGLLTAYVVAAKLCMIVRNDLRAQEAEEMKVDNELSMAEAALSHGARNLTIPDARTYESKGGHNGG